MRLGRSEWHAHIATGGRALAFPGGESYRDVADRVRRFVGELAAAFPSGRVLIIGHSATRFALDHLLRDTRLEDLVDAPFEWQPGWLYTHPARRTRSRRTTYPLLTSRG